MVIANEHGKIDLVNARTERLFGYKRDELLGQPVEMLIPRALPRAAHSPPTRLQRLTPAQGAGRELFGLRKDGSEFPVEISLSPFRTQEGRLVFSAIRDITLQEKGAGRVRPRAGHGLWDCSPQRADTSGSMASRDAALPSRSICRGYPETLTKILMLPKTPVPRAEQRLFFWWKIPGRNSWA